MPIHAPSYKGICTNLPQPTAETRTASLQILHAKKEPRNPGFLSQRQTNPYFKSKDFRLSFLPYLFAHFYPKNPLLLCVIIIQEIVVHTIFFISNDGL